MTILQLLANEEYFGPRAALAVGDPVKVDGHTQRGVVVKMRGRRVTIRFQDWRGTAGYRNGFTVEKDAAAVHKL